MINELEILDIVDENDNVIGQQSKRDVHAGKNILHREVGVLIFDEQNRILLQQRSFKKRFSPGAWTISAIGHVPAGKTPEEAAHMELTEELGFDTKLTFLEKRMYVSGDHVSFGFLYTGIFPSDGVIKIEEEEVVQARFANAEDVAQMKKDGILDSHTLETMRRFCKF